jgi:predicted MFS family arabinose efflux permease
MSPLLLVTVVGFGGFAVLFPVAPLWVVRGGQGAAGAGLVNGTLLLATVATQPFVPRALARLGAGWSLAAAMLLLGLPAVAMGFSDDLGWALGMSGLRGVGFGVLTVTGSAVVAYLVPAARRGEAIGFYGLGIAVPNVVLLPASVALAEKVGYWPVFAIGALPLLGVPAALALGRDVAAVRRGADPLPAQVETSWHRARGVLGPAAVLFAVTLPGGALMTFLPQLTDSSETAFFALLALGLVAAIGRWRIGRVADRSGASPLLLPLLLTMVVGLLLTALAVAGDDGDAHTAVLLTAVVVVGIGYGTLQNLTLLVALSRVAPGDYGRASAIWNVGFDSGTALGSVLVGLVASSSGFSVAFLVVAGLVVAVLPLTLRSRTGPGAPGG